MNALQVYSHHLHAILSMKSDISSRPPTPFVTLSHEIILKFQTGNFEKDIPTDYFGIWNKH